MSLFKNPRKIIGTIGLLGIVLIIGLIFVREYKIYNNTIVALSYAKCTESYLVTKYTDSKVYKDSDDRMLKNKANLEASKAGVDGLYNNITGFTFFNRGFRISAIKYIDCVNEAYNAKGDIMPYIKKGHEPLFDLKEKYSRENDESTNLATKNEFKLSRKLL